MIKQIPYGLTDFGRIQKENYYYVDKTMCDAGGLL